MEVLNAVIFDCTYIKYCVLLHLQRAQPAGIEGRVKRERESTLNQQKVWNQKVRREGTKGGSD